jgi:phosphatidate cytidylyltransferase
VSDSPATTTSMASDLKRRVPSAIAMILLALGATWYGGFPFLLFWTLAALIVWYEWATVVGATPRTNVIASGAIVIVISAIFLGLGMTKAAVAMIFAGALGCGFLANGNERAQLWCGLGLFYAALVFIPATLLRADPKFGFLAIIWLYAVVWLTDIGGYFCGRFIGGPKLAPAISPKKTWSGAIGGTFFGVLGGALVATLANAEFAVMAIVIALIVSMFSQAGDIFESFVKRKFDKKDSSGILPGHGGVMDRVDGFIAASAIALLIGLLHQGVSAPATGLLQW